MTSENHSHHSQNDINVNIIDDDEQPIKSKFQNANPAYDNYRFHDGHDEVGYESDQLNSKKYDKLIQKSKKRDFERISAQSKGNSNNRVSEKDHRLSKVSDHSKRISKSKKSISGGGSSKRQSYKSGGAVSEKSKEQSAIEEEVDEGQEDE